MRSLHGHVRDGPIWRLLELTCALHHALWQQLQGYIYCLHDTMLMHAVQEAAVRMH